MNSTLKQTTQQPWNLSSSCPYKRLMLSERVSDRSIEMYIIIKQDIMFNTGSPLLKRHSKATSTTEPDIQQQKQSTHNYV